MYCLAKAPFNYYVYGESTKVKTFIEGNYNVEWKLQFFPSESSLLIDVNTISDGPDTKIVNLLNR